MSKADLLSFGQSSNISAFVVNLAELNSKRTAVALGDKPEIAALFNKVGTNAGEVAADSKVYTGGTDKSAIAANGAILV